jgi:hypothetical protein
MFGLNPIFYDCQFDYTKILGKKKKKKKPLDMDEANILFLLPPKAN